MLALETLLVLAGLGQIALFAASFAIPRVMRWSEDLAKVHPPFWRGVLWPIIGAA